MKDANRGSVAEAWEAAAAAAEPLGFFCFAIVCGVWAVEDGDVDWLSGLKIGWNFFVSAGRCVQRSSEIRPHTEIGPRINLCCRDQIFYE